MKWRILWLLLPCFGGLAGQRVVREFDKNMGIFRVSCMSDQIITNSILHL